MSVSDSVFALMRGAQRANAALAAPKQPDRIGALEFIELYHDRAVLALEALDMFAARRRPSALPDRGHVAVRTAASAACRTTRPADWWQRLQILGGTREGEGRTAGAALRGADPARAYGSAPAADPAHARRSVHPAGDRHTRHEPGVARTLSICCCRTSSRRARPIRTISCCCSTRSRRGIPGSCSRTACARGGAVVVEHGLLRQLEAENFRRTFARHREHRPRRRRSR